MGKEKKMIPSSQQKQKDDGGNREDCAKLDNGIACAVLLESSYSNRPRERGAKRTFSSDHSLMAAVVATNWSEDRDNIHEKRNEYAPAGTDIYVILDRRETEGIGERKVSICLAEPFHGKRTKELLGSTTENAEPMQSRQGRKKMVLHSFYCRCVFRNGEVDDCAVLKKMNLTALGVSSRKDLTWKVKELKQKKRKAKKELKSKNEKLRRHLDELKAAKKTTAMLERVVRG